MKHGLVRSLCLILLLSISLRATDAADLTHLSPGVLVDTDRARAWVANEGGLAQAINLDDGETLWRSGEQAFPLTLYHGQLLALGQSEGFGSGRLLLIDLQDGKTLEQIPFELPETVAAHPRHTPSSAFELIVEHLPDALRLHWQYRSRPLRGALMLDPASREAPTIETLSGTVDLRQATGRSRAAAPASPVPAPQPMVLELLNEQRLAAIAGRQFRAASGEAILASEVVDTYAAFPYRWRFHDADGERLGELQAATSRADFVVAAGRAYYRAPAHGYRNPAAEWVEAPERLVAFDLRTGVELWAIAVMDRRYRGPLPP